MKGVFLPRMETQVFQKISNVAVDVSLVHTIALIFETQEFLPK